MTNRKLLALALTVFVLMGVVSGGMTVGFLSDSETVNVTLSPDIPESAANDGGDAGNNAMSEAGNNAMSKAGNNAMSKAGNTDTGSG